MRNLLAPMLVLALLFLTSCASQQQSIGSIMSGECRLVNTPSYAVRGRTNYDQAWVNKTTEALVDGCNQSRPKARPASFDAPAPKKAVTATKPLAPVKKKRRFFGS